MEQNASGELYQSREKIYDLEGLLQEKENEITNIKEVSDDRLSLSIYGMKCVWFRLFFVGIRQRY